MSISPRVMKTGAVLLSGVALGGAVGFAASASGASTGHVKAHKEQPEHRARAASKSSRARLLHAVSLTAVVPDGRGHFSTLSIDRGTLTSVSGDQLTLKEGRRRFTYKTVTISLPSDATIRLSRQPSSLSALAAGDRVEVVQGPKRTSVIARPPSATSTTSAPAAG